jgi:hypothetical protein
MHADFVHQRHACLSVRTGGVHIIDLPVGEVHALGLPTVAVHNAAGGADAQKAFAINHPT